jgi:hypothetical protein
MQAVGQFCFYQGPYFQNDCHDKLLSVIAALLGDASARVRVSSRVSCSHCDVIAAVLTRRRAVQAHAALACVNFADHVKEEVMAPYVDALLPRLYELLAKGSRSEKENAITAIASLADAAIAEFERHFDSIMPPLMGIVETQTSTEMRMVRGKSLECLSIVGGSVAPERFV